VLVTDRSTNSGAQAGKKGEVLPTRKIVVIGGGVGGMSAAHELIERSGQGVDFDIHVYDQRADTVGGKARSIPVPGSATGGRGHSLSSPLFAISSISAAVAGFE